MSPYLIAAIAGSVVTLGMLAGIFRSLYVMEYHQGSNDAPILWYLMFLIATLFTIVTFCIWGDSTYPSGGTTIMIVVRQ